MPTVNHATTLETYQQHFCFTGSTDRSGCCMFRGSVLSWHRHDKLEATVFQFPLDVERTLLLHSCHMVNLSLSYSAFFTLHKKMPHPKNPQASTPNSVFGLADFAAVLLLCKIRIVRLSKLKAPSVPQRVPHATAAAPPLRHENTNRTTGRVGSNPTASRTSHQPIRHCLVDLRTDLIWTNLDASSPEDRDHNGWRNNTAQQRFPRVHRKPRTCQTSCNLAHGKTRSQ